MTYQERKQWLERYRVCIDRIEDLREIQRAARDSAERVTPGTSGDIQQSGNDSRVERAIVTIRSAEKEIKALEDAGSRFKREIVSSICGLSPKLSTTATVHFIQGVSSKDLARISGKTKRAIEKRIQKIILYAKIPGA